MPVLPPPRNDGSTIITTTTFPTRRKVVAGSSTIIDEPGSVTREVSYSYRNYRSSNKPIRILSGTIWKPCSSYIRSAMTLNYTSATVTTNLFGDWNEVYTGPPRKNLFFTGPFIESNGVPITPSLNTRNRLATELLQKIGSRKASYGESIAESRQAIKHLAHTTSTVVKTLLYARKGRFDLVAKELGLSKRSVLSGKSLSSRYLEYQYAWLPLINDIYDTHQLITKGFREKSQIMSSVRNITDSFSGGSAPYSSEYFSISGTSTVSYRNKVFYSVDDTSLSRINQLGLLNPAEIAWAVVPYSFVVDWFLPVGNFLEALTATVGVNFIDGFVSTRVKTDFTISERSTPVGGGNGKSSTGALLHLSQSGVFRQKQFSFPTPGLYVKSPFSTSHGFSALALLRQLHK